MLAILQTWKLELTSQTSVMDLWGTESSWDSEYLCSERRADTHPQHAYAKRSQDFTGGPVLKKPPANAGDTSSTPARS